MELPAECIAAGKWGLLTAPTANVEPLAVVPLGSRCLIFVSSVLRFPADKNNNKYKSPNISMRQQISHKLSPRQFLLHLELYQCSSDTQPIILINSTY